MQKAFRIDDYRPIPGTTVSAFRSLEEMRHVVRLRGGRKGLTKFWEISGFIVHKENLKWHEGVTIKVSKVKRIN